MNLNIAAIQHPCGSADAAPLDEIITQINNAAQAGAELIILPELHNSAYFCQTQTQENFKLAETIPGRSTDTLSQVALDNKVVIVASLFENRGSGVFHNTAVVIDKDASIAGCYRKMHIPDDPGYNEKYYFTPGDLGFEPIECSLGKLGVLICWDQWFPEAARIMALKGAELLIYPTAIGWEPSDPQDEKQRQLDAWQTVQRGHAIANHLPVVCCNRVGFEAKPEHDKQGIDFWGNSFVCGQQGEWLAQSDTQETILFAKVDLNKTTNQQQLWPFLRDRRIDAYKDLLKRKA